MLSRYRGYWGNKIPRADLKTDLRRATQRTWCSRRMLKIKWTDRIKNEEVFQKVKEERLLLKNRRHSWIGHTIRHNEFVVNILEGAISGKKGCGTTSTTILKASRQKHRS